MDKERGVKLMELSDQQPFHVQKLRARTLDKTTFEWSFNTCRPTRPEVNSCIPPTLCTIGASGCGSAAATIIVNSFGSNTSVVTAWNTQHKNNGYAYYSDPKSCASYDSGVIGIINSAGLSVSSISVNEIENILKNCGLVLALVMEKWTFSGPTGHFIVIKGIQKIGSSIKVVTMDPLRSDGFIETVVSSIGAAVNSGDIYIKGLWG